MAFWGARPSFPGVPPRSFFVLPTALARPGANLPGTMLPIHWAVTFQQVFRYFSLMARCIG